MFRHTNWLSAPTKSRRHLFPLITLALALSILAGFRSPALPKSPALSPAAATDPSTKPPVLHELYPRSFQDSTGDGIGDINGIISRLDYLRDLGIGAIWITPMYPSPQVDFGYDISDYTAIDPVYGTLADFDRLVAEAKKRD